MKKLAVLFMLFSGYGFATPVNINTATAQQISTSLLGIGIKKAEAIVTYREAHGPFRSADELGKVFGIGEKTVENNRADILLAPPAPTAKSSAAVSEAKKPTK